MKSARILLLSPVLLLLGACSASSDPGEEGEEIAGETYEEYDQRREGYDGERGTFAGKGCTVDCSGHDAGYAWAEEHDITDPDQCGGKSWSFVEGCRAYAEEQ